MAFESVDSGSGGPDSNPWVDLELSSEDEGVINDYLMGQLEPEDESEEGFGDGSGYYRTPPHISPKARHAKRKIRAIETATETMEQPTGFTAGLLSHYYRIARKNGGHKRKDPENAKLHLFKEHRYEDPLLDEQRLVEQTGMIDAEPLYDTSHDERAFYYGPTIDRFGRIID